MTVVNTRRRTALLYLAICSFLIALGVLWFGGMGSVLTVAVSAVLSAISGTTLGVYVLERRRSQFRRPEVLPPAGRVDDPTSLGVHPATINGEHAGLTAYVPRDIDHELRALLRLPSAFALIIGDAVSGKTRTAFEAVKAELLHAHILVPAADSPLAQVVENVSDIGDTVLWLDDLERYLSFDGLTLRVLDDFLSSSASGRRRVVVATMRSSEFARQAHPVESEEDARRALRSSAIAVLSRATLLRLGSTLSAQEFREASSLQADPLIQAALTFSHNGRLAEYLAGAPSLGKRFQDSRGLHPRARALVSAAVDLRRAGYGRPIPRRLVEKSHTYYLPAAAGNPPEHVESLKDAWNWVTSPILGSALLSASGGNVEVNDYLVAVAEGPIPAAVLVDALVVADKHDAHRIGLTAYDLGSYAVASEAFRRAYNIQVSEDGPDHPDTLTSRNNLALALRDMGRWDEALAVQQEVLAARERVLGPDHPDTLTSRNNLALALRDMGRWDEALAVQQEVLAARERVLGPGSSGYPHQPQQPRPGSA
ncbi:tetratricopeptide repeat protein [Catellatospora sichuanensis]|uniref:tetratricopeptide repeat protein n=1 Tax=Catellatospora sichuanensis TaxID=1969805 RepID=UPI001643502A|nr:tetratricopeptide repeat protein [Catellatospora sichuanensis]